MEDPKALELTIGQFITQLAKDLNIREGFGILGKERQFIALVEQCPFLYDRNNPDFKNTQKKDEAWKTMARIFGVSVGATQTKWKNIRDQFNKSRKPHEYGGRKVHCLYSDQMAFLEPFILPRRVFGSMRVVTSQLTDEDSDDTPSNGNSKDLNDSQKSMLDETIQFIEAVKSFPILYHHKYSTITHKTSRAIQWKELAKSLGISVKVCLDRWKNLREKYSRERRQMIGGKVDTKWRLFDELNFLDSHIRRRRSYLNDRISCTSESRNDSTNQAESTETISMDADFSSDDVSLTKSEQTSDVEFFYVSKNIDEFTEDSYLNDRISCTSESRNDSTNQAESTETILLDADFSSDDVSLTKSEQTRDVETRDGEVFDVSRNINEFTEDSLASNNYKRRISDEDDLFGQTIAAELRQISCSKKKMKLKAEIYRLLYDTCCN